MLRARLFGDPLQWGAMPPPPKKKKHGAGPRGHRDIALDPAAIDAALAPIVPEPRDRAFVLRCVVDEGPRHHRGASWALLRMLAAVLAELGGAEAHPDAAGEPVQMRLPPSLAAATDDGAFPVGVPTRLLGAIMDEDELAVALASLHDGPPHHAVANAVMATLIDAIHWRVTRR